MKRGFTLIEFLVVIAIVAILSVVVLSALNAEKAHAGFWADLFAEPAPKPKSEIQESNAVNKELRKAVPVPQLETSSERANVARRATIFDNEDKISYIYLVNYGRVMAFFTVQGKVSSLRSYMTPVDKLVDGNGNDCRRNYEMSGMYEPCYVVESADIDGTYGENVDGIFFFTTEGAYVEWRGDYMMSDQPLKLTTQPELVRQID